MLIGFKFRNFRSFLSQQEFSFSASPARTHESSHSVRTGMKAVPRLAKTALLFGANASGKTNILVALQTLRDMALHSTAFSDVQFSDLYTPFQLGRSVHQPTEFEIDVLLDQVRYRYSVAYDAHRIWSERLLVYRTGKAQRWFERVYNASSRSEEWTAFSPSFNGPREMWRKATRARALFLTTAAQLNSEQLNPLMTWFEHGMEFLYPTDTADVARMAARIQDPEFKTRVLSLLRCVDIQVDDVRVADPDPAGGEPGAPRQPAPSHSAQAGRSRVEFLHASEGRAPIWIESEYEAAGTHRLFGLFGPLLLAMERGKLLLIDEFDANLHPLVSQFLIKLVSDPKVSAHSAQFLLVSHNTTLMDLDAMRRDEIWLVQLDGIHGSNLSPLARSRRRKRERVAKGYLQGRYGAIPLVKPELCAIPALSIEAG